jgi:alpha-D-xyloside xylohydrolase
LWWDFPEDAATWNIQTAFMFGDKYLVCPVTAAGATTWDCYLPALAGGAQWTHHFTKKTYSGGVNVTTDTPLDQFPLFYRD